MEARSPDDHDPLATLAFKIMVDQTQRLTYVRLYSGTLKPGQKVYNPIKGAMKKVALVLRLHTDEDTSQTLLSGMGELRLERDYYAQIRAGRPQMVYRETIWGNCKEIGVFHREPARKVHFLKGGTELIPTAIDLIKTFIFLSLKKVTVLELRQA